MVTVLDTVGATAPAHENPAVSRTVVKPEKPAFNVGKFENPDITLKGEHRAKLKPKSAKILWFNTGTLCNIECVDCYIESGPTNSRLQYLRVAEVERHLNDVAENLEKLKTHTIGITGGEPCMNPDIIKIITMVLERGFKLILLTNAMRPMQRPKVWNALQELIVQYPNQVTIRVSIDHYDQAGHEAVRGEGAWAPMVTGLQMLSELARTTKSAFQLDVAGHKPATDDSDADAKAEAALRAGYAGLFWEEKIALDAHNMHRLVLFPKMQERELPEITTSCWSILDKQPHELMCSSQPTIVHRQGAERSEVMACTLVPYDKSFTTGDTVMEAMNATISLNHFMCATCMLSGVSCSG